jgi:hypothetical protein
MSAYLPAPVLKPKANDTMIGTVVSSGSHNPIHGWMSARVITGALDRDQKRVYVCCYPDSYHHDGTVLPNVSAMQ